MITRTGKLLALAPVAASFLLSDKTLASFGVMLVGGMVFWIPYWLAWWLSDGFAGMSRWPGAGVNPGTGKPCTVYHHPWGTTYVGGD